MSEANQEDCREAFERWCMKRMWSLTEKEDTQEYVHQRTAIAWEAWQAAWQSRPAVVGDVIKNAFKEGFGCGSDSMSKFVVYKVDLELEEYWKHSEAKAIADDELNKPTESSERG